MLPFDKKGSFYELAQKTLRPTLTERDQSAQFSRETWGAFSRAGLFALAWEDSLTAYYEISRASLDLPYTSSLAAHGFVSQRMLEKFGSPEVRTRYRQAMQEGRLVGAICNSEDATAIHLKDMKARYVEEGNRLLFTKPCITNGGIADLFFTTLWTGDQNPQLEIFVLEKDEVEQTPLASHLTGFRSGDSGRVIGTQAKSDLSKRRLAGGRDTLKALRYCFYIERLVVATMATGLAHGLEDCLARQMPQSLLGAIGDHKQYLQEKVLDLHMARVQMSALIQVVKARGLENIAQSESELAILKIMISRELRAAIYSVIEVFGHRALQRDHVLPKVLRDVEMCSFFGGTRELQKISLMTAWSATMAAVTRAPERPLDV